MINNKLLKKVDYFDIDCLKKINAVFEELSSTSDINKRIQKIIDKYKVSEEQSKEIVKSVKSVMQTHSLSYKAMLEYIPIGIEYKNENNEEVCLNQMQYFYEKFHDETNIFANKKYIPTNLFEDEIISPTVRRSFIQTINVFNKIIKLYGNKYDINNITLELPREKNSYEERKKIRKINDINSKELQKIFTENNLDKSLIDRLNSKTKLKLKLLAEQDNFDIYDGEYIDPMDVINNPEKYQEEHIIPYSISFVDARYNKVITKSSNNYNKGNKTPYH